MDSGKGGREPTDRELRERLSSLGERIGQEKAERSTRTTRATGGSGFAVALRLSSEFVSAILVGAGLGYLVDRLAGTTPWAMILLLMLGFAAGVLNVLRAAGRIAEPQARIGEDRNAGLPTAVRDDDDED